MQQNRVYYEDNLLTLGRFPDNCLDAVITSPPYDGLRKYNGYSFDFETLAKELFRTVKPGGVVVWVVGDATVKGSESGTSFRQALYFKETGFNLHDTMIWFKPNGMPTDTRNRYNQCFEYMFVFSKGQVKTFNKITIASSTSRKYKSNWGRKSDYMVCSVGKERTTAREKNHDNIFSYPISVGGATKDKYAFKHPAIFPEQLATDQLLSWTKPGDLVYDPFMGSGTVAKACILNGRNY